MRCDAAGQGIARLQMLAYWADVGAMMKVSIF